MAGGWQAWRIQSTCRSTRGQSLGFLQLIHSRQFPAEHHRSGFLLLGSFIRLGRWVAVSELPECLPYHQRPGCWLFAPDPMQCSSSGLEVSFVSSFLRLGMWMSGLEQPECRPYHQRPGCWLAATDSFVAEETGVQLCGSVYDLPG